MRVQWKALKKKIPAKVTIGDNGYEVLWTDGFKDPTVVGEKRVDPHQIVLKTGESDTETVKTYLHEVIHAWSDESGANLTESQVVALESLLPSILKQGNIFIHEKPNKRTSSKKVPRNRS
jgi:hypothetical protein